MAAQQLVRRPIQPVAQAAVRAAATSGAIRPVKSKPGVLWDPDRQKFFKLVDTLVHGQYDTALFQANGAGVLSYGQSVNFAQNVQSKQLIDTNFSQPRRLIAGQSMWVSRIGLYWLPRFGDVFIDYEDIITVVENTYFVLKLNRKEILQGPSIMFPSGFGYYGNTTKTNTGIVSVGLPSMGGVLTLAKKQFLNESYDIDGQLQLQDHQWASGSVPALAAGPVLYAGNESATQCFVAVKMILHGRLYSPATV